LPDYQISDAVPMRINVGASVPAQSALQVDQVNRRNESLMLKQSETV